MLVLNRQQLAQFLPNHEAIKAFEQLFQNVAETIPSNQDDVMYQSAAAQQQAGEALMGLAVVAEQLALLLLAPIKEAQISDSYTPPNSEINQQDSYNPSLIALQDETYVPPFVGEPPITPGTSAQYWRGDKSWQTLNKSAVGLGNVDNTADNAKTIRTASGSLSVPTGPTTMFTLPGDGIYTVAAYVISSALDAWFANATIVKEGTDQAIRGQTNAAFISITISGANVQATVTGTQTVNWYYFRIA